MLTNAFMSYVSTNLNKASAKGSVTNKIVYFKY